MRVRSSAWQSTGLLTYYVKRARHYVDDERNPGVAGSNPVGPITGHSSIVYEKAPKPL